MRPWWKEKLLLGQSQNPIVYTVDFSAMSVGAMTTPSGLSVVRSTVAGAENGDNAFLVDCAAINQGRIAQRGSNRGLRVERATTNRISNPRRPSLWPQAASNGSTTDNAGIGPDGLTKAALHAINSGGFGRYYTNGTSLMANGTRYTGSLWMKKNTLDPYQFNLSDTVGNYVSGAALPTSWLRYSQERVSTANGGGFMPADGRLGGIAAGARNYYSDLHQLEAGTLSTWIDGTRAGDQILNTLGIIGANGSIKFELIWTPTITPASAVTWGITALTLWRLDASNYIEINTATRKVKVVIGGQVEILPNALPAWSLDDTLLIRVDAGNGIPTGSYIHNGGPRTSLGSGSSQPYLITGGANVDFFSNGTTQQLQGIIQKVTVYR